MENSENSSSQPELFAVSELLGRYDLGKTRLYERMKKLNIKPHKVGTKSYLDADQLSVMDELHKYITQNGSADGFPIPELREVLEEELAPELTSSHQANSTPASQSSSLTKTEFSTPAHFEPSQAQPLVTDYSGQQVIEELMLERAANQEDADLEEIDDESQLRAAKRIMAGETLTLLYEATENFTKPGLKNAVDAHRSRCRAARRQGKGGMEDFLNRKISLTRPTAGSSGSVA
jgi:hypothetical protein